MKRIIIAAVFISLLSGCITVTHRDASDDNQKNPKCVAGCRADSDTDITLRKKKDDGKF